MAKKIKLSKKKKEQLKKDFDKIGKRAFKKLPETEQRYYNILKASKASQKKRQEKESNYIEFEGKKYYDQDFVQLNRDLAKQKGLTVKQFLNKYKEPTRQLIKTQSIETNLNPDGLIDELTDIRQTDIYINDGNGLSKYNRIDAIKLIADFNQFVKVNSTIVEIRLPVVKEYNRKWTITMSLPDEYENIISGDEEEDNENIIQLLESLNIFYIDSPKKYRKFLPPKEKTNKRKGRKTVPKKKAKKQ